MLRLIFGVLLLFGGPVLAADPGFVRAVEFPHAGPGAARGALVWIHGTYGQHETGPPPPPDFVAREAASGLDVWCFNRDRRDDPLPRGAELLVRGIEALRASGYRQVIVSGHSRGAWIALTALARPGLADAVVAFSPAAHGTREARRAAALADWAALWAAAVDGAARVVLVQLAGDPWDPDPARRLATARARLGGNVMAVFLPETPRGHGGVYEPGFDEAFGAAIAAFAR